MAHSTEHDERIRSKVDSRHHHANDSLLLVHVQLSHFHYSENGFWCKLRLEKCTGSVRSRAMYWFVRDVARIIRIQ